MCFGSGRARRVRGDRVEAERDRDLHPPVGEQVVGAAVLVDLPVHRRRPRAEHLHAVHADVPRPGARVVGDHGRERDERARVVRPAGLHREHAEVDVVSRAHDLLAGALADRVRARVGDRLERLQAAHLRRQAFGRLHLEHVGELLGDVVEPLDAEGEAHPPLGPELVDQQRDAAALRLLEEQRRAAGPDGAVDDLGDLEVRVDLGGDADELALALEERDPLAQVAGESHELLVGWRGALALGAAVAGPVRQLAERDHGEEDQPDDQHPLDDVGAFAGGVQEQPITTARL